MLYTDPYTNLNRPFWINVIVHVWNSILLYYYFCSMYFVQCWKLAWHAFAKMCSVRREHTALNTESHNAMRQTSPCISKESIKSVRKLSWFKFCRFCIQSCIISSQVQKLCMHLDLDECVWFRSRTCTCIHMSEAGRDICSLTDVQSHLISLGSV